MTEKQAERKIRSIIFKYIEPGDYSVFIFGSRASDSSNKYSDFDIGILGDKPLPLKLKYLMEEELEESNIPFNVDIVDFSLVNDDFKKVALEKTKKI